MASDAPRDFIREIVAADVEAGTHGGRVTTRFPPEPNGFLHIGHAKAICLDFGVAREFGGGCNLRMDDTNPETEDPRYVEAIERDVRWLGFAWEGGTRYASDYFEPFYRLARRLIEDGLAYVDSLSDEEIRGHRGTVTEPGRPSPHRTRPPGESLDLFDRMRAGEFPDGAHVLRAKIDLASPNMKMRDPLLYRIRHARHYRTGDDWPIYPMYDWAHPLSDAIEGVTHSFCTLEFDVNRPLYDWVLDHTRPGVIGLSESEAPGAWDPRPRQYEFARLNLDYTVMSKRKLARLVRDGHVAGWDDPRMPTLAGLRRGGVPPEAIRAFCDLVGVSRSDQRVDIGKLEYAIRDELNRRAPRVMAVLRPLRVVVENFPEDETEWLEAPYFPRDVEEPPAEWPASRRLPFTRELFIERDDFREDPPKGFRRLAPGREVRLRYGYFLRCREAVKDEAGEVVELRCTYDPETRGGSAPDGRKPSGTIHWVSATRALPAEVRLYDRLFAEPDPEAGEEDFLDRLNPESLEVVAEARIEPSVADDPPGVRYQFERIGYFVRDREAEAERAPERERPPETERPRRAERAAEAEGRAGAESSPRLVFNRTVSLRDTWARRQQEGEKAARPEVVRDVSGDTSSETSSETAASSATDRTPDGRAVRGATRSEDRERARAEHPGLAERFARWRDELGLSEEDADILTGSPAVSRFFEEALAVFDDPRPVANWVIHEVRGATGDRSLDELPFGGAAVGELVALVERGTISQRTGRDVLARMLENGGAPGEIVEREGLERIGDRDRLAAVVDRLLAAHPEESARFAAGEEKLLGFFVGQAMRETEGRADPEAVKELLRARLG